MFLSLKHCTVKGLLYGLLLLHNYTDFIHFDKETSIKRLLLNLNTKDDFDELKIKVKLTENDMENHANNNKRISELQSMQIFDKNKSTKI